MASVVETLASPRRNFSENATARYRVRAARLGLPLNSDKFLPPPTPRPEEELTDSPRLKQQDELKPATDGATQDEAEKHFIFNGERVPLSQLRSKMFQTSKTARGVPIPMRSGGFTFQK